ncbi:MAG: polyprenyl diphosphate synthase [Dehalococcoidia bacterium]
MKYHIGLIPDGNRRWARARGLDPWEGHRVGAEKAELFLEWCADNDEVGEISVYALSEENFGRSDEELKRLYRIYEDSLRDIERKGSVDRTSLKVNLVCTKSSPLPRSLIEYASEISRRSRHNNGKVLNMLLGYTGQSEIIQAVSTPRNRIRNLLFGLSERDLEHELAVKRPCDLIIRTGDEERSREAKSGFLLWQSAYSEYYHIDKLFPDTTLEDFQEAWNHFKGIARKKGL